MKLFFSSLKERCHRSLLSSVLVIASGAKQSTVSVFSVSSSPPVSSSPVSPVLSSIKLSVCKNSSSSSIRNGSFVIRNGIGFTLVELMIVIAIIGVLAASLFPMMSGYMAKSRDTATQANIRKLIPHISGYINDMGGLPGTSVDTWYCIPLNDNSGSCAEDSTPILPGIEILNIKKKDFNLQETGFENPIIAIVGENYSLANNLTNKGSGNYYLLNWTLPGTSGYSGSIGETNSVATANTRCSPGTVRWINFRPDKTACQIVIQ